MRMQKHIAFVVLGATLLALAFASPALATYLDSTYTTWSEASTSTQPGYDSPHGGFATTTKNCAVCHAVHWGAGSGVGLGYDPSDEMLLRERNDRAL